MKTVSIALDRDRNLGFNLAAVRLLKSRLGKSLVDLVLRFDTSAPAGVADADALSHMLLAGLAHEDGDLTIEDTDAWVEQWAEEERLSDLRDKVLDAVVASGLVPGLTKRKMDEREARRRGKARAASPPS